MYRVMSVIPNSQRSAESGYSGVLAKTGLDQRCRRRRELGGFYLLVLFHKPFNFPLPPVSQVLRPDHPGRQFSAPDPPVTSTIAFQRFKIEF